MLSICSSDSQQLIAKRSNVRWRHLATPADARCAVANPAGRVITVRSRCQVLANGQELERLQQLLRQLAESAEGNERE